MFDMQIDEAGLFPGASDDELDRLTAEAAEWPEEEHHLIPPGLDEMPPGPNLAAILSSIDRTKVSGYDLVVTMRARARQIAYEQAELYADIAETARCMEPGWERSQEDWEFAADELRAALNLTRKTAEAELSFALELRDRLPQIFGLLRSGNIDLRRAKVIYHQTRNIPVEAARAVVDEIIDDAPDLTSGQLYHRLRKLCIDIDPDAAKTRFETSKEERRVVSEANPEGTANVYGLNMEPHRVGRGMRRMRRIAMKLKRNGDPRTVDQIMADVFVDILNGDQHTDADGGVIINVDLATLTELDESSGELAGYGPVIADIARQVAAEQIDGEWRWTATHPDTGAVLADGTTRRRPTAEQRRYVEARHRTCVHPGCRMPSADCDLDHTEEWSHGGLTLVDNIPPACRHDHILRHEGRWRYRRGPKGEFIWTSPLGHTYITRPQPP